jgi:cell division protein FtsB
MTTQSPSFERRTSQDQRHEVNERNERKTPPCLCNLVPSRSRIKNKEKNLYHSEEESSVFLVGDNKIRFVSRRTAARLGGVKADVGIWGKLTQVIVALTAIAVVFLVGMKYVPLIQQNEQYRRRVDALDAELQRQREISKQLEAELEALRQDPKTMERLAREKLGYAKADETVIHFEPPTTNQPIR